MTKAEKARQKKAEKTAASLFNELAQRQKRSQRVTGMMLTKFQRLEDEIRAIPE